MLLPLYTSPVTPTVARLERPPELSAAAPADSFSPTASFWGRKPPPDPRQEFLKSCGKPKDGAQRQAALTQMLAARPDLPGDLLSAMQELVNQQSTLEKRERALDALVRLTAHIPTLNAEQVSALQQWVPDATSNSMQQMRYEGFEALLKTQPHLSGQTLGFIERFLSTSRADGQRVKLEQMERIFKVAPAMDDDILCRVIAFVDFDIELIGREQKLKGVQTLLQACPTLTADQLDAIRPMVDRSDTLEGRRLKFDVAANMLKAAPKLSPAHLTAIGEFVDESSGYSPREHKLRHMEKIVKAQPAISLEHIKIIGSYVNDSMTQPGRDRRMEQMARTFEMLPATTEDDLKALIAEAYQGFGANDTVVRFDTELLRRVAADRLKQPLPPPPPATAGQPPVTVLSQVMAMPESRLAQGARLSVANRIGHLENAIKNPRAAEEVLFEGMLQTRADACSFAALAGVVAIGVGCAFAFPAAAPPIVMGSIVAGLFIGFPVGGLIGRWAFAPRVEARLRTQMSDSLQHWRSSSPQVDQWATDLQEHLLKKATAEAAAAAASKPDSTVQEDADEVVIGGVRVGKTPTAPDDLPEEPEPDYEGHFIPLPLGQAGTIVRRWLEKVFEKRPCNPAATEQAMR